MKRTRWPRKTIRAVPMTDREDGDLPESYQPMLLRPLEQRQLLQTEVMYACGYLDENGYSIGMFWGPHPKLEKALNVIPDEDKTAGIFRFNLNGTDVLLYRWSKVRNLWRRANR